MNLPPFYIGQKVVYITGNNMPKDSIHTVTFVCMDICGCYGILINGESPILRNSDTGFICVNCNTHFFSQKPIPYNVWDPKSFRSVQQQNFPLMTFSKIVEKEREEILINN